MGINNLGFRAPVFPGDSVALKSEVIASRPSRIPSESRTGDILGPDADSERRDRVGFRAKASAYE